MKDSKELLQENESKKNTNQDKLSGSFDSYFVWRGMFSSYNTLLQEIKLKGKTKANNNRLRYLQKQIVLHFLKNFFVFPFVVLKFLVPSFLKGDNNIWTNIRSLFRDQQFQPLRMAVISQVFFVIVFVQVGLFVLRHYATPIFAATYGFVQTDWSGGASTTAFASHVTDQSGWAYYYSRDSSITTAVSGEVSLILGTNTSTDTTDSDFSTDTTLNKIYVSTTTNSFQLLKQNGATCTTGTECNSGTCSTNVCSP